MKTYMCTECGHETTYSDDDHHRAAGWQQVERKRLYPGAGALPVNDVATYEREEPVRAPSVSADFSTPFLQAAASGLAGGLVAIPITIYFALDWWWPFVVMALAFAFFWLGLLRFHSSMLVVRERVTSQPEQQQPPPAVEVTRLAVALPDGNYHENQVNVSADKVLAIAKGVVNARRPFSEREWCGRGRLLSGRTEYQEIRDTFMKLGWLAWKDEANKKQGLEWTRPGTAALKALASGHVNAERLLY